MDSDTAFLAWLNDQVAKHDFGAGFIVATAIAWGELQGLYGNPFSGKGEDFGLSIDEQLRLAAMCYAHDAEGLTKTVGFTVRNAKRLLAEADSEGITNG